MNLKKLMLLSLSLLGTFNIATAQSCPPNLDFELGTTANWTYYRGQNNTGPVWSLATCAPVPTLHRIHTGGVLTDPYGGFPTVGDGNHSLQLGKDSANNNADAASFNIHVPTGVAFPLVYRYAYVLEDPGHTTTDRPRFEINVIDSATGLSLPCYPITYTAAAPGLLHSSVPPNPYFQDWTAGNINITGMGGKTLTISFKVGGCTTGAHWGYAYIDMNCGNYKTMVVGCSGGTTTMSVPTGFSSYLWTDSATYTHSYGTTPSITVSVPTVTTTYAAIVQPYSGYGCKDTLYYKLVPTSMKTHPANDTTICFGSSVRIWSGATDILPMTYSWTPSTGLSCTTCDTVLATPPVGVNTYLITTSNITGCSMTDTVVVTVLPVPGAIGGSSSVCAGSTTVLTNGTTGGKWTSGSTTIATIGSSTGIVSGVTAGMAAITYSFGLGCSSVYTTVTVLASPSTITGVGSMCAGSTSTLSNAVSGGSWSSSNTSVATISTGGLVAGLSGGTSIISYTLSTGCAATKIVTVNAIPAVTVSSATPCGSTSNLTASGATTYLWSPSVGLSCSTCSSTGANPSITTAYTVTGTTSGCSASATITVNGDRIFGHITFSGATPDTLDMKAWLIQFDPSDSSIKALDSVMTCVVDSVTYYEFTGKPAGSYMVKAKMIYGSLAGGSGYVPTYSLSAPYWYLGATTAHTGASDSLHITMVYGTVPAGPGFIGGYVYSGAGKGTSGETLFPGMLMYLEDATTHEVLAHTYTNSAGAYSFSGIAYGNYIVYPEEFKYNTTPSTTIGLTSAISSVNDVNFKRHTSPIFQITPFDVPSGINDLSLKNAINVYPNPANDHLNIQWQNQNTGNADVLITNVVGRKVYKSILNIGARSGEQQIDLSGLTDGIYLITIKSATIHYNSKFQISK